MACLLDNARCDAERPVDSLIYVRLVPPTDDALVFVVTFARELQHFVQAWQSPKIYAAGTFLSENLASLDPGARAFEAWQVPIERDAMIRSKHVADAKFGRDIVAERVGSLTAERRNAPDSRPLAARFNRGEMRVMKLFAWVGLMFLSTIATEGVGEVRAVVI